MYQVLALLCMLAGIHNNLMYLIIMHFCVTDGIKSGFSFDTCLRSNVFVLDSARADLYEVKVTYILRGQDDGQRKVCIGVEYITDNLFSDLAYRT